MCGIAGFFQTKDNYLNSSDRQLATLKEMAKVQQYRGPDDSGTFLNDHFGLSHVRLSIIDLAGGQQPMFCHHNGGLFGIVYNGEIYNSKELRRILTGDGYSFSTTSDTELLLAGYALHGIDFVKQANGIFAYAIMDCARNRLCLFRDRLGVKPLFYTQTEDELIFSSELKGLFAHPSVTLNLTLDGLNEVFSLGPAKTRGSGVFSGIYEVLPGQVIIADCDGIHSEFYWKLEAREHTDSEAETVEKTRFLVTDSIKRQMVSDVPICTFLSGGVDSSIVSSVCARELLRQNKQLATYSFDFVDNDKYFTSNSFQPSEDRPFVDQMVTYLNSDHHYLFCSAREQEELLTASMKAHDLPCMADVDSSMLYFCSLVGKHHKVVLTGECADEIFGGYPWFHKESFLTGRTFPWTPDLSPRKAVLREDFLDLLHMDDYVQTSYETSIAEAPLLPSDSPLTKKRRQISWLNLCWFMQTLLDRMDRCSMQASLEARVPFADHRIVEYLYNVPWEITAKNGEVKYLLRESMRGLLPDEILFRKKSPYPKTYDPHYEQLLKQRMNHLLEDTSSPLWRCADRTKVQSYMSGSSDYGKPWYGQLMAAPQMLAYLIQIHEWLKNYKISF